ncbi:MAG: flagellar hook-associated protein FlgL [Verrucomicrobia bacterium]|nr:flagellar hook-associated protein FlgL [Verrucomicrobiota bacterium]
MRVSSSTFPNTLVQQLSKLTAKQSQLQNQIATGQKLTLPEDDPTAMHRVLDFQTEESRIGQYQRNITYLRETAEANYNVMKGIKKISDRAGEIATLADDTKSPTELRTLGQEVTQLIKQAVQMMNGKLRGDYLFGGTRNQNPPYELATDSAGKVTSVTYQGNSAVTETEIAENNPFSVQVTGANTSGSGPLGLITDSRTGADFFNHLISLQQHLLDDDNASVTATDRPNLANDEENIISHLGSNGAMQARLDTAESLIGSRQQGVSNLISKEADADLSESIVRLSQSQTAYQAALQSASRILDKSLMDYLR